MEITEKFRSAPPRGGVWRFVHPVSGTIFTSPQLNALKYSIQKHEEANGYALTDEQDIETQLCKNHPASCGSNPPRDHTARALNISDIVRGTKVIAKFKLAGSPLVPKEQAEHRAYICSTCKKNVHYSKPCSGLCPELDDLVKGLIGDVHTSYDDKLKACAICACSNAAQVHVPAEILKAGVTEQMMTEFALVPDCWKYHELRELEGVQNGG